MGWKKLLILFLCLQLNSCKNYYYNSQGGTRPKTNKFSYSKTPYTLKQNDAIDANSIYLNTSLLYYGGKEHEDYHILRFFPNGRYNEDLVSKKEDLNSQQYNNVNNTLMIGYYKIEDNNKISLEYFRVKHKEGGFFQKRYGYIKNDSIFLFYNLKNNSTYPKPTKENCRIYVKKEIEGLTGNPDW